MTIEQPTKPISEQENRNTAGKPKSMHVGFLKIDFVIRTLQKIGVDKIFDEAFTIEGKEPDIPYGISGMILIANIICSPLPLYRIADMFQKGLFEYDLKGTLGIDIMFEQLNDDRFGNFLDRMQTVGCRKIFAEIMTNALMEFEVKLQNINYDTTTKTMWGTYEYLENTDQSSLHITYGYNKQKRKDKKQIVVGLGVSGGFVVDAKVLSGNKDDKTYNYENVKDFVEITEKADGNLYYIADSAAGNTTFFEEAQNKGVLYITRLPDNYKLTISQFEKLLDEWKEAETIKIYNISGEERIYRILEGTGEHDGVLLKTCVYFNHGMMKQKYQTIEKRTQKEKKSLSNKISKITKNPFFESEADAKKVGDDFVKTHEKKLKSHDVTYQVEEIKTPARGKKAKDPSKQKYTTKFRLDFTFEEKENLLELQYQLLMTECMFMLVSNDLSIDGEKMITEYKTQSSVEVKFRQLKNDYHPNSLYVKKPERVEALMYLSLIGLQVCSLIEHVVRGGLKDDAAFIRVSGNKKEFSPTFVQILNLLESGGRVLYWENGVEVRSLSKELTEDQLKILKYMGISVDEIIGIIN